MNSENILGMLVKLGSLMRQNSERLNAIAHLNPTQEQLASFQDNHNKLDQLIRELLKSLIENDPELKEYVRYRLFEIDLEDLLKSALL